MLTWGWEPREYALVLSRVMDRSETSWHCTKIEHKCNNNFSEVVKVFTLAVGVAEVKWSEKTGRVWGEPRETL